MPSSLTYALSLFDLSVAIGNLLVRIGHSSPEVGSAAPGAKIQRTVTRIIDNPPQDLDFEALARQYYQPLYRFALSLARNESDASDLVQQTFLIWARKGHSLRDAAKVKSWLFTTLYREYLRVRRRIAPFVHQEPEVLENELPAVSPEVLTTLDAGQAVDCLQSVDEIYRAPLTLYYLEHLSYKEIADTLSVPIGTVMSRLSRGKIQLKNALLHKKLK
jgi:RNA polymerase sigma-70 factor (ECF subfamily)